MVSSLVFSVSFATLSNVDHSDTHLANFMCTEMLSKVELSFSTTLTTAMLFWPEICQFGAHMCIQQAGHAKVELSLSCPFLQIC